MMNNPDFFFGNFSELKIKNYTAEVIFKNDSYNIIPQKLPEFTAKPELVVILYQNGRKILEQNKKIYSDSIEKIKYDYDNCNNLILIDNGKYKIYFHYDTYGHLVRKEKERGIDSWCNRYFYENNNLIKEEWRSQFKALIDFFYEYDSNNNQIKKIGKYLLGHIETFFEGHYEYNSSNKLTKSIIEEYDDYKREFIIKETNIDYGKYLDLITYKESKIKDSHGVEIEVIEEFFEYDKNGFLKSFVQTNNGVNWKNLMWEYEYDENLNWTSSILFEDNKPTFITKREFKI